MTGETNLFFWIMMLITLFSGVVIYFLIYWFAE
jgi:hypothetical protein